MEEKKNPNPRIIKRPMVRYTASAAEPMEDMVAEEYPFTLVVDGEEFATMVCSPTHLEELVPGFLASEGLIRSTDDLSSLDIQSDRGFAYIELKRKSTITKDYYAKRFIGSCCGKSRQFYFHNDMKTAKTVMSRIHITPDQCFALMREMEAQSDDFKQTGGLHNAALCTSEAVLISRTDIGRHNALDKIFGYCLREKLRTSDKIIAFSGRISSEVLLKAAKIGAGIILSKSAPTSLALDLAQDLGITAVGFIRKDTLNVYTHPERIVSSDPKHGQNSETKV
jgi:FdhD protein